MTARGYVYAATGDAYVTLARRSARSLRKVIGADVPIDLFTDQKITDPVFDRVHALQHRSRRPKMEALRNSRFQKTVYLDADTICVAPIDDIFDILDRADLAACAEQRRNDMRVRMQHRLGDVPAAFPQINSGVIGLRKSPATDKLLQDWHQITHSGQDKFDQHSLRYLLFHSDLRFHTLPAEYNVLYFGPFMLRAGAFAAPRLLHLPVLHKLPAGDPSRPLVASDALGPKQIAHLAAHLQADQTIAAHVSLTEGGSGAEFRHPHDTLRGKIRNILREYLRRPIR